jgi:hypothetical protein
MRLKRFHFLLLVLLFSVAGLLVLLQREVFVSTVKVVLKYKPDQQIALDNILGIGNYFELHNGVRSVLLNAHLEHLLHRRIDNGAQNMLSSLQKQLRSIGVKSQHGNVKQYNTSVVYFSDDPDASIFAFPCNKSQDETELATLVGRAIVLPRTVPVILWECSAIGKWEAAESYSQLDKVTSTLKRLQHAAPGALVGWITPKELFGKSIESVSEKDGMLLWHYLNLKHLVHDNGFLVIPRTQITDSGLEAELVALLNLLPYEDTALLRKGSSASLPLRLYPRCVHILNTRKYVPFPANLLSVHGASTNASFFYPAYLL